jgi:hypothetical protein
VGMVDMDDMSFHLGDHIHPDRATSQILIGDRDSGLFSSEWGLACSDARR